MVRSNKQRQEDEVIEEYNEVFNESFKEDILLKDEKEEMFLYNYFNHKLRCGDILSDREKKVFLFITNKLHSKYGDYFNLKELKNISTSFSLNYPERKYNNLIISHTLKEKKHTLINLISSFISAYDNIVFYRDGVIQKIADPNIQKMHTVDIKRIYVLNRILEKARELYHNCFIYYHNFLDGDNVEKNKAYILIEMAVDDYNNHKIIKDTINISNNLSYIALKNYTPVNIGEVGASPQEIQRREGFLSEEESSEDENIDSEEKNIEKEDFSDEMKEIEKDDEDEDIEPL